jgi:hypothetical protein
MAHPQVADGGDGLQVWRVTANILNKESRTADKGWSSNLGVGRGANNSTVKYKLDIKCHEGPRTRKNKNKETASQEGLSSVKLVSAFSYVLHRAYMRNIRYCCYILMWRHVHLNTGTQNSGAISKVF